MTDHNKQRKEAMQLVDRFVDRGTSTKEQISFHVMRLTGFSEKFVIKYIEQCLEHRIFKEHEGLIKNDG